MTRARVPRAVPPGHRWSADFPCPVCGSHQNVARGQSERCWGYISSSSAVAYCTREEHAGGLKAEDGRYAHRLGGRCRCGARHKVPTKLKRARLRVPRPRKSRVEVISDWTPAQLEKLKKLRVASKSSTLKSVGAKLVGCYGKEWLGLPAINEGSWKLLAINGDGKVRREAAGGGRRRLARRNVGPASFIVPTTVTSGCDLLYDVEGETDLLRALDAGIVTVICATTGATSAAPYKNAAEHLARLQPNEVAIIRDRDEAGDDGRKVAEAAWLA